MRTADKSVVKALRAEVRRDRDALAELGALLRRAVASRQEQARSARAHERHVERAMDRLEARQVEMLAVLTDLRRRLPDSVGSHPDELPTATPAAGPSDARSKTPKTARRGRSATESDAKAATRRRPLHAPGH